MINWKDKEFIKATNLNFIETWKNIYDMFRYKDVRYYDIDPDNPDSDECRRKVEGVAGYLAIANKKLNIILHEVSVSNYLEYSAKDIFLEGKPVHGEHNFSPISIIYVFPETERWYKYQPEIYIDKNNGVVMVKHYTGTDDNKNVVLSRVSVFELL